MRLRTIHRAAAVLCAAGLLSTAAGCGGKKEEPAPAAEKKSPEHAKPAPTPASKPAAEGKAAAPEVKAAPSAEQKMADLLERTEKAYRAAYCAVEAGQPGAADKAYTDHGFKSPSHFQRAWKHLAEKDGKWAKELVSGIDEKSCEKK